MSKFLKIVAEKLAGEFGNDLGNQVLVFPNRRSILFFTRYLSSLYDKPLWAPEMVTINEMLTGQTNLKKADPLMLIFELYKIFRLKVEGYDSFDEFYFWGEMLVNDFDDIDKYMVDASDLFRNLSDLKEIDERFGGYDEETIRVIRQFWINFEPEKETDEKQGFLKVWSNLYGVYKEFRSSLREKGIGYDGMIIRDLAELTGSGFDWTREGATYHFIGFNALNECEKVILDSLKRGGKARFYWDYDEYFIKNENHEAGYFLRDNIRRYGDEPLPGLDRDSLLNITVRPKEWKVINAPSDVAQAKLLPGILGEFEMPGNEPDSTAVVLSDENMLSPVLNSIPAEAGEINVTMGYPLYQTPVYSLVNHLVRLQKNLRIVNGEVTFYHNDVLNLLKHQYLNIESGTDTGRAIGRIREFNMIRVPAEELSELDAGTILFREVDGMLNLNSYIRETLMFIMEGLSKSGGEGNTSSSAMLQVEYIYHLVTALNRMEEIVSSSVAKPG
ncbi:MAG: hypothetical protein R2727_12335, partial [Bacteroidales bacterium]